MPLNLSGPISLAGATAGESIAVELGLSSTGTITLDQANVRSLAGVPSGAITMPTNFYGKSVGPVASGYTIAIFYSGSSTNGLTGCSRATAINRVNACGAIIGSQTNIFNCSQLAKAAAPMSGGGAMYIANGFCCGGSTRLVRINSSGALIGSITTAPGTMRINVSAARTGSNTLLQGGDVPTLVSCCCGCYYIYTGVNTVTRVNSSAALIGSETNAGLVQNNNGSWGTSSGTNSSLFYTFGSQVYRINACGAAIGSTTSAGTGRLAMTGTQIGANACRSGGLSVFYGGGSGLTQLNRVTRINSCGTLVGSEGNVGTARQFPGGATVGSVGMFFGSPRVTCCNPIIATRINVCGTLVGSETTLCSATRRRGAAGGSS